MKMKLRGVCSNCGHEFNLLYITEDKPLGLNEGEDEDNDPARYALTQYRFDPPICPKCGCVISSATEICRYVSVDVFDPAKTS